MGLIFLVSIDDLEKIELRKMETCFPPESILNISHSRSSGNLAVSSPRQGQLGVDLEKN